GGGGARAERGQGLAAGGFDGLVRLRDGRLAGGDRLADDEIAPLRPDSLARQLHRLDHEGAAQRPAHAGGDRLALVGAGLVAALEEVSGGAGLAVVGAGEAGPVEVTLAWHAVDSDEVRLEDGAEGVMLLHRDGVEEMVMTAGAVERDAE